MNEKNRENETSGQIGPKSKRPHAKFREYSEKSRPSERLQDGEPPTGKGFSSSDDRKAARESRRMEKSTFKVEKTGAKLDSAVEKRNKKKSSKNPGIVKSVRRAAQFELNRYVHNKMYQAENENVGVEAAHRAELAGERVAGGAIRFIKNRIRTRPARRVRKYEKRNISAKTDLQFRKLAHEHPELNKNAASKFIQKQKLKRRYQKQAREAAKKSAKAAKEATKITARIAAAVGHFFVSHPIVVLIVVILIIIVILFQSCTGMAVMLGSSIGGTVEGTSDTADTIYTEFETDLQSTIDNMEATYPGYGEYRYNLVEIGHKESELMGFLMVFDGSPYDELQSILKNIFDEQYTLTTTELKEERQIENEDGEMVTEEIIIMEITLTSRPFAEVITSYLTPEQLEKFNSYDYT